jgi:hypothetical protein
MIYNIFFISQKGLNIIISKYSLRTICLLLVFILLGSNLFPVSVTQKINIVAEPLSVIEEDMILFVPMQSSTVYLIDKNESVAHTWSSDYLPGESVYLLDDGSIFYTIKLSVSGGGAGGGVQKITWDNELVWDYRYYNSNHLSHHDIEPLSNGNILMIAWESKTRTEAIESGRDPNKLQGNTLRPDHIIEVKPTGPTTGEIVWKWHVWDHLIQDYDATKDNYGVIGNHPELIDINFGTSNIDWLHTNSIDYNEELDQILVSVRNFDEVWVIDHSTTTEEAAGHTGGNSGMGGDILYRWGNPATYHAGYSSDRKFFSQHDARWIDEGCPGEGNILVFNNGGGRPGPDYTSVDEIVPPLNGNGTYNLEPGEAYGPDEQTWIYNSNFYSYYIGGAQRLKNGNTIVCDGPAGKFYEVTPDKDIIWDYRNPYPNYFQNSVFKINYYTPPEESPPEVPDLDTVGSLRWLDISTEQTVQGGFEVQNVGGNTSTLKWIVSDYPSWGNWTINPISGENLTPEQGPIDVKISIDVPNVSDKIFQGIIRIENQDNAEDFDTVPVYLRTTRNRFKTNYFDFLKEHPLLDFIFNLFIKIVDNR